jgi:Protein of unknown function (DUF3182)
MVAGVVVIYLSQLGTPMYAHERVTLAAVANTIAQVKHYEFGGYYDNAHNYSGDVFFVPDDTLMLDEALCLGIRSLHDLFGGVVPHPFVKTKSITHGLITSGADRPEGWSPAFAQRVRTVVLPGYSVFSARDARIAAARMLSRGAVRVKEALGDGGKGQILITTARELGKLLERFSPDEISAYGLVLETHLRRVTTLSVGQITIDGFTITYHGTQRTARNNEGRLVYGGSHLVCVRGGWEALDGLPMTPELRIAVSQARSYDQAASEYPGFLASRRNYDVAQGVDNEGQWRSGVLEASWRSGGASTAELTALAAFVQSPGLQVVEASAVKEFGKGRNVPRGAIVHFRGDDPEDGPIVRYTVMTRALRQAA